MQSRINYKELEEKWQQLRYDKFKSVPDDRESFTILLPPPNVTGHLHCGHFLNSTICDIIARRKRQEGFNVCFAQGLDHAGLATQMKVEQYLRENKIDKNNLTREEFLSECNNWKNKCGGRIIDQFKRLGLSVDSDRLTFTLDPNYSKHVVDTFVKLYDAGYVFKGNYLTNWCIQLQTAISDEECIQSNEEINLYYIKYKLDIPFSDEYLTVATTRPETLFGDVAVAFNPEDIRYTKYKGMSVIIPILNKSIPLIEDPRIKIEFGTGLCKITPGHDKDDFVTGQNYNLPIITILDKAGHITNTNTHYDGMYKEKARKEITKELENLGMLEHVTKKQSQVLRCGRSNCVIEPLITKQWFIQMDKLAKSANELLDTELVKFYPDRIKNNFSAWVKNIKPWCVSRQSVYGHLIPIYYCSNGHEMCKTVAPTICTECADTNIIQETDTLDTWASSYVYQFATFSDEEIKYYCPLDVMVTGQDILFFWIMRMMISNKFLFNIQPFNKVLFHGIIRDEHNQKMSKSKGNAIDPLDIIEKNGVDPMRFAIMFNAPKETDLKISNKTFDVGKTFCTKLWNVCRFLQTNELFKLTKLDNLDNLANLDNSTNLTNLTSEDNEILEQLKKLESDISKCYEELDLQCLTKLLYSFVWDTFANGYLEYAKLNMTTERKYILLYVYKKIIIHLYPIIPHLTEEIWEIMGYENLYLEKF